MPNDKIAYRTPCCGGKEVFGTSDCDYNTSGHLGNGYANMILHKTIIHNYTLWYAIVQVN